jgi:signal transduction histidine kinase
MGPGAPFAESLLPALHREDRPRWRQVWDHAVASHAPYELKRRARFDPDAEFLLQRERGAPMSGAASSSQDEWIVVVTAVDEPDRIIAELRGLVRLRDEYFAYVAHELRGPLAAISAAASALARRGESPEIARESCAIIDRQTGQLVRLVGDAFDRARSQRDRLTVEWGIVDLKQTVSSAIESVRPLIAVRQHDFAITIPAGSIYIDGDQGRLVQVFANLLENAAKYTDVRGQIRARVELQGGWVLFGVRDSGAGIDPQAMAHIFEPFTQVGPNAEGKGGLGLGLAIVRQIVERHGGTVSAGSEGIGRGSEFLVRLPRTRSLHRGSS